LPIDEALLRRHVRYEDAESGISEAFLTPELGGGRTVAVLSRPLSAVRSRPVGWVICHSFAREQVVLAQLDTMMARALASAGFTALRFHAPGYGDSWLRMQQVNLQSHLGATEQAVELMAGLEGVEQIGVIGARFGGMVAACVGESRRLPFLALWEPITKGAAFMRELLRSQAAFELTDRSTGPKRRASPKDELLRDGWADVQGFHLTRDAFDQISGCDLYRQMSSFGGDVLIGSITRTGHLSAEAGRLAAHLRKLGAACSEVPVQHDLAPEFGRRHYLNSSGTTKTDLQLDLSVAIAQQTAAWAVTAAGQRKGSSERPGAPDPLAAER
jgi:pimeloyl-ACP methyl ester carboxylesterase